MSQNWQSLLARWTSAGLIDPKTADSIRTWEEAHDNQTGRNRFAIIAFGFGGLLLVSGVLLFVASNWQGLSPTGRFMLLTTAVAVFHGSGAYVSRVKPALATTLHAVGTGTLGAAIFLSGQTFNLAENWPDGFLLWAIGAAAGLYLLRDWPHVLFAAALGPLWLWSEIEELARIRGSTQISRPIASFAVLLALAYLSAVTATERSTWRRSLSRLGGAAFIPTAVALAGSSSEFLRSGGSRRAGVLTPVSWILAILLPAALAYALRRKDAAYIGAAALWVLLVGRLDPSKQVQFLGLLTLYASGSVGVVLWGLRDRYRLSINLGVVAFALSILAFYFASGLFTQLGRSIGLIGAGLLFIGGGWLLERTRRTIIGKIAEAPS